MFVRVVILNPGDKCESGMIPSKYPTVPWTCAATVTIVLKTIRFELSDLSSFESVVGLFE